MLNSKQDYINCLTRILEPLKGCYSKGKAYMKCGETGVLYGQEAALIEAFARPLWGLAPLWGGGEEISDFDRIYLEGIINGTDPESEEYWGKIGNIDQKQVETAPMGLALVLAPEKVWEPLTAEQKKNFKNWLWQMNEVRSSDNNWNFFSVLVNLGLKNVGEEYDAEKIRYAVSRFDSFYRGDGWYCDGNTEQIDYYIAFAIHFYALIYAKVMEKDDPEHSRIFKERAMLFAQDFIYWFADDGSALAFGRSLTYRFAQVCFWSACIFAGIEPFPMGVMKGIISRNLEYWLNKPIFDNGGVLTVGYEYPNLNMAEEYNAFGSPYWALKTFLILALDENHSFFKAEPLPLPELAPLRVVKGARMVLQRKDGHVFALTSGQWLEWGTMHVAEKYSKFAYSSKYAFSIPRTYCKIEGAGTDSMLTFIKDGMCHIRRKCLEWRIEDDGTIYSRWSPFAGVEVETCLIPTAEGHIRKHTINSDADYTAYDCAFAEKDGAVKISGGEEYEIVCVPNTNLKLIECNIKAVKYEIKKGINRLETITEY
ncbi:MAG: DUF2264 domain-containing protein [Clostridia bacterium]|nr:DUF2264 domain-containing protein [Clostridia bacterium]